MLNVRCVVSVCGLQPQDLSGCVTPPACACSCAQSGSWVGGRAVLVQTGDIVDRGPHSLATLDFFEALKVIMAFLYVINE